MIRRYVPEDFRYLEKWVTDAGLLLQFSGPDWSFPLTSQQIVEHEQKFPFRRFYMGCDDQGIPYAFGQLIWNEPHAPRLGRLLVGDPGQRGKGRGSEFIRELIAECATITDAPEICLFVFKGNDRAIRCYERCGFVFSSEPPVKLLLQGEEKTMYKMIRKLTS